ncbi:MAG: M1 family aminopeptidase [Polyangia bacterium]
MNPRLLVSTALLFSLGALGAFGLGARTSGPNRAHAAGAAPAAKRSPEGTDAPTLRLPKLATPQRYAAELTLVPSEETFAGKIAIELAVAAPTKVLWLNMGPELKIQRVQLKPGASLGGRAGADGASAGGAAALGGRAQPSGQHFVALRFERPVPAGRAVLQLEYQGKLPMSEEAGLYRERVGDDTYIYSDFEPVDARRAFPCFDEPGYKVPWQLTLHVKREHVALSNTPAESETDEPGGMKRVVFRETAPLPSYLIALAVGPFGIVDAGKAGQKQTPIRIITFRGHEAEARYAAQSSGPILAQLEQYLGIPYPYEKIDQIAVPGKGGAMENPGLITYGERLIQIRPEAETVPARRRFARVCAHELAHQWTGNLVTLLFWDDLWLNESLASFLESKIIGRWQPGWQEPLDRVAGRQVALGADSLLSARKIRQPIESHDDIVNAFDAITYAKGRAVLEMFESFLGEAVFQRGLNRYLREHAHKSGTAPDLISAWQAELREPQPAPAAPGAAGTPATAPTAPSAGVQADAQRKAEQLPGAIASLLDQPGAPLLSLKLSCEGGQARLLVTQQRYLPLGAKPEGKQPVYQVPLCARYRVGDQPPQQACVLFDAPELQWTLPGISVCPDYVVANANAAGYYRVRYDAPLLEQLVQRGVRPVEPLLSTAERVSLIGDLAALTRSGQVPADKALAVAVQAARDPSWQVLSASLNLVLKLRDAVPDALWPNWRRLLDKTYSQRLRSVGLRLRAEDDEDTRILRLVLMNAVIGEAREPQLYAESLALVRRWLNDRSALEPEVAQHLVPLVARHGDRALFDELLAAARREKDATVRGALLSGLGSFEDQGLARAALNIVLGDEFPMAEAQRLLYGPLGQPGTRRLPFLFVKEHFDALVGRLPREGGARLAAVGGALCTDAERTEVESFFTGRSTRYTGGPRILKQSLERIGTCTAFTAAQQGPLADFLRRY